jgi:hypothetical protein
LRAGLILLSLLLLPTLLGLAACGPLPRPFQPEAKALGDRGLTRPPGEASLAVGPVAGLLPEDSDLAAAELAAELRRYNLAAAAGPGNAQSVHIDGRYTSEGLLWLVSDPSGGILATERQTLGAREEAFLRGEPDTLSAVMAEAAVLLLPEIEGKEVVGLPGHPGARLVIAPIEPAPPEAARLLASSMRVSLSQSALPIVEPEQAGPNDLWLRGSVRIGPPQAGRNRVDVIWELFDPQERSLGRVSQGDMVPTQQLSYFWPDTAPYIAEAAVAGVVDLLYKTAAGQGAAQ